MNELKDRLGKEKMLDLIERLINRLNEINGGSFVIDDKRY